MKKSIFIFFIFLYIDLFGSSWKVISKSRNYEISDVVCLGEIISVEKRDVLVKRIEIFKGTIKDTIITKIDNYSFIPRQGEVWLLYAKKLNEKEIYVSNNSWSRSFDNPFAIHSKEFPKPPPQNISEVEYEVIKKLNKSAGLSELRYDILSLRQLKNSLEFNEYKENNILLSNKITKVYNLFLILISAFVVLVIGYIPYKIRNFLKK